MGKNRLTWQNTSCLLFREHSKKKVVFSSWNNLIKFLVLRTETKSGCRISDHWTINSHRLLLQNSNGCKCLKTPGEVIWSAVSSLIWCQQHSGFGINTDGEKNKALGLEWKTSLKIKQGKLLIVEVCALLAQRKGREGNEGLRTRFAEVAWNLWIESKNY